MLVAIWWLGAIISAAGGLSILGAAFKEGFAWGMVCLCIPGGQLIFIVTHWAEAKVGFILQVIGGFFIGLSVGIGVATMDEEAVVTALDVPDEEFADEADDPAVALAPPAGPVLPAGKTFAQHIADLDHRLPAVREIAGRLPSTAAPRVAHFTK